MTDKSIKPVASIHIKIKDFLQQWDKSSKKDRLRILQRFVKHFQPQSDGNNHYRVAMIDAELGEIAPLFFSRIVSSFQINHLNSHMVSCHVDAILLYLQSLHSAQYTQRFINCGGIQLILHVLHKQSATDIQSKCLLVLQLAIASNCKFKELICMDDGLQILLNLMVDKANMAKYELLYLLYTILKQLCVRNDVFTALIHESIFDCIAGHAHNHEAVKLLLKVLQSTLRFDDDVRFRSAGNDEHDESHQDIECVASDAADSASERRIASETEYAVKKHSVNAENMRQTLKLLHVGNHQIIYEVQRLCNVLFRSEKLQPVMLKCVLEFIDAKEDSDGGHDEYSSLLQKIISENSNILTIASKQLLINAQKAM